MPRIHAFELEDQPWLPRLIRDYATDFLQFMLDATDAYGPVAPLITRSLQACGTRRVVDIGSGGGGPWFRLAGRVRAEDGPVQVVLTDLYPSRNAAERVRARSGGEIRYHDAPVDALHMPEELDGFRTLFTALHHFRPVDAQGILAGAVRGGHGIGVFEFSERSIRGVLMTLVSPLLVLVATPLIRPFRWSRLFWTYAVPVVPLVVLWDGVVSALRTYTPDEMEALGRAASDAYVWTAGRAKGTAPVPVSYLIGLPPPAADRVGQPAP
jgi:SAM-dependent methyltransferase